jgi:hypothetical protein
MSSTSHVIDFDKFIHSLKQSQPSHDTPTDSAPDQALLDKLASIIHHATHIVAILGAGVSVSSGIPVRYSTVALFSVSFYRIFDRVMASMPRWKNGIRDG